MKIFNLERQRIRDEVIETYKLGKNISAIIELFPQVSTATIYRWIKEFKDFGKTERKTYPITPAKASLMGKVLALYQSGLNYEQIQHQVKVVSSTTVRRWIKDTPLLQTENVMKKKKVVPVDFETTEQSDSSEELYDGMTAAELLAKYRESQTQLKKQEVRLAIAETMIDVAEKQFGINIRKKHGAK